MQPTVISYSRVSSNKQLSGTGLAQQKDTKILNQLSEEYGLVIDDRIFSDAGVSGYHSHNLQGEFGKILELINTGSIVRGSILAITSLDRLSRAKTNEAMELMLSVINRGIRIYTAMDNKLYSNDSANLTADLIVSVIIMAQAHEESLKKSQRTRGNAIALINKHNDGVRHESGRPIAITSIGSLPWWISIKDGSIKAIDADVLAIKYYVDLTLSGIGAITAIDKLTIKFPHREWTYGMLSRLHKRESLIGKCVFTIDNVNHELIDYLPRIITDVQFYQLTSIKKNRVHARSNGKTSYLTGSGILKCRQCGGAVSSSRSQDKVRLVCINKQHRKASCDGFSLLAEPIEQAIEEVITGWFIEPKPVEDESSKYKLMLEDKRAQLKQAESDYMDNPSNVLAKMLGVMETDIANLESSYKEALVHSKDDEYFGKLPGDTDGNRLAIKRSFESIHICKVKRLHTLISLYSKRGFNMHIYLRQGKIIKADTFYTDLNREDDLKDKSLFLLFINDGSLDHWLRIPNALDDA